MTVMPLTFKFDVIRATQAAAKFLDLAGGTINYTKLLKLLYFADRQSLIEVGKPITGSSICNMNCGPVLSEVYDCIKQQDSEESKTWGDFISTQVHDAVLVAHPKDTELSDYDLEVIQEVFSKFKSYETIEIIEASRKLPEWERPSSYVAHLYHIAILYCSKVGEDIIQEYEQTNSYMNSVDQFFSSRRVSNASSSRS
jgi:uncharacterized phage-associated protein